MGMVDSDNIHNIYPYRRGLEQKIWVSLLILDIHLPTIAHYTPILTVFRASLAYVYRGIRQFDHNYYIY